ncbi:MAG: UDP-N-acetylmuramate dehydrogenase [Alphaproteobacteria bacterium]|nr:UDP-N-acetylmuramate dehydrogenase [Alphaproteobacteria bacterium]
MIPSLKEQEWGLPSVRGRYTENAPLGEVGWFRCGGTAEVLFKPADPDDLAAFLAACPKHIPVTTLGVLSNTIVRDGGVRGVVIRLGKEFAGIEILPDGFVRAGAVALDGNVAQAAARAGIAGLEFFSGIPGTIGGALRMNAGCYGSETKDVLVEATAIDRMGGTHKLSPLEMGMSYRHSTTPEDYVFTAALFQGQPGQEEEIKAFMAGIKEKRGASQPIREKTGGSTFANPAAAELEKAGLPAETKVWQLIDRAGCRGLTIGGAMMSELHANFMINTGTATATELEALGEEVRRRVLDDSGISLRWEIKRIGEPLSK